MKADWVHNYKSQQLRYHQSHLRSIDILQIIVELNIKNNIFSMFLIIVIMRFFVAESG